MSDWITPKTDWSASDYWNTTDYNRIVNNMYFLKDYVQKLFLAFDLQDMQKEKKYYEYWFAEEMNLIEQNLVILNEHTYNYDIGDTVTYVHDGKVQTPEELNRIESTLLKIYNSVQGQILIMRHLPYIKLGGQKPWGKRGHVVNEEIEYYRCDWRLGLTKGGFKI